jgi:hypothetical protein
MKTIQVGGRRKNSQIAWAMVSDEDFERVSQFKWSIIKARRTIYVATFVSKKAVYLHRFLMGLDFGDKRQVNHIDGNGLNNQRENIEVCTALYNNQSINKPNTNKGYVAHISKYWHASINVNKVTHQKNFATEEEGRQFIADKITDKIKGSVVKSTKPWYAKIAINKVIHQKNFATEEEARQFISDKLSNKINPL